jgi:hypothetical protein
VRCELGICLLLVGCGFEHGQLDHARNDAPPGASDTAIDVPVDAPPTWQVIETLTVDIANPNAISSQTVLANGVVYHLRASGLASRTIDDLPGDADYWDINAPKDSGCCEDIGLGIDDLVVNDLDTKPDWGAYTASHVYEVAWTGKGAVIQALYQDTYYGNNAGTLTLEILELR